MAMGRRFLPEEGVPGNDHSVVLTHKLWEGRFHSDPNILGQQVEIEGRSYTIVGVRKAVPQDRGDGSFSVPLALSPGGHNEYYGNMFGRLKPGVSLSQAQAELSVIDRQIVAARTGNAPKEGWLLTSDH